MRTAGEPASQTRAHQIAAVIRERILTNAYHSGERIIELSLAGELNVSQNTIRDALRLLEQEGWVVKHARHGVHVRRFTQQEAAEIFTLMQALESLALHALIARVSAGGGRRVMASPAPLRELSGLVDTARQLADASQTQLAVETLFQLHEAIARYSSMALTLNFLGQLYNYARILEAIRWERSPRSTRELDAHVARHITLVRHIQAGDAEEAQAALKRAIEVYSEQILLALRGVPTE
jgi:DNA-binding GntR family transcriptional regulator